MKYTIIRLMLWLTSTLVWAGTWSDGFEKEKLDAWQNAFQRGLTTSKVENGELIVEVHSSFVSYFRVIGSTQWEDYTVSVRVKILKTFGPLVDGGIMIRERNVWQNNYYFFIADRWTAKDWQQVGEAPYPGTPPKGKGAFVFPWGGLQVKKGKAKAFNTKLKQWYALKAVAERKHVEFYVDGDLVGSFDYGELSSGGVGLVISNALVHFDAFVVTGAKIPDGGHGGASLPVESQGQLVMTRAAIKQGK